MKRGIYRVFKGAGWTQWQAQILSKAYLRKRAAGVAASQALAEAKARAWDWIEDDYIPTYTPLTVPAAVEGLGRYGYPARQTGDMCFEFNINTWQFKCHVENEDVHIEATRDAELYSQDAEFRYLEDFVSLVRLIASY